MTDDVELMTDLDKVVGTPFFDSLVQNNTLILINKFTNIFTIMNNASQNLQKSHTDQHPLNLFFSPT